MCGGGGGGDPAEYQREQDKQRRQRIDKGKKQLDQLFAELEGKSKVANYDYLNMDRGDYRNQIADILNNGVQTRQVSVPRQYNLGAPFMGVSGNTTQTQRSLSPQAEARLRQLGFDSPLQKTVTTNGPRMTGINSVSPFMGYGPIQQRRTSLDLADYLREYDRRKNDPNSYRLEATGEIDPIWQQQEQAYMDFAMPQLQDQYGDAKEQMAYALSRQGVGRSSIAGENRADLQRDYDVQKQNVAEQGKGVASRARSDIAQQKQSLLNMLSASADPGATATAARSALDSIRSQPSFSPVGPLFQNATAGLAAGYAGNQSRQQQQRYNDVVYGGDPDRSSGVVRR